MTSRPAPALHINRVTSRVRHGGRHAPPALHGVVGWLVELISLLAAWLVSLRAVPRHARRVRLGGQVQVWPLRTVLLVAVGVVVFLVFAAAGAYVIGGGLVRILGYLLAGRP